MVDGDEGGCTADHFGRGDRDRARARDGDSRTLGAGLIGAGILGIGASDVGALVSHGTLAIAAAVGHGVAVLVGARDTWVYLVGVPRLLVEIRGGRGNISGSILHRQVVEAHGEVLAVARPAVLKRRGGTSVIKLLEAIVEAHTHAAVDTEVVV